MYRSLIFIIYGIVLVNATNHWCFNKDLDYWPYMGTRTPYHVVGGELKKPEKSNCEALQVWGLIRHGTRYLKEVELPQLGLSALDGIRDEIMRNHQEGGRGEMCQEDLEGISKWDYKTNVHGEDDMTPLGRHELRSLGERLRKTFPEALEVDPDKVNPEEFVFQATNFSRTISCIGTFQHGLFGKKIQWDSDLPVTNDELLLPQKRCPAWKVRNRPADTNKERDTFQNGPEIFSMLKELGERLGYNQSLPFEKAKTMYEICRFESAWNPQNISSWCRVFSQDHLKYFEYRDDLNYYYCCGSGQEMAPKLGCKTLGNMFQHFENRKNNVTNTRGVFYFANTLSNQALMAILEIGKYPVFNGTSYAISENRTYRNSVNAAFGTNLFGIFYKCENQASPYKVQFQLAEKVVPMPGCDEEGLCDWEELKMKYKDAIETCSMDFCFSSASIIHEKFSLVFVLLSFTWVIFRLC